MSEKIFRMKFEASPTESQKKVLEQCFGATRWIYNNMLVLRDRSYKEFGISINLQDTKTLLSELKSEEETSWLSKIPSQPLQESVIDLDNAYKRFFNQGFGYPKRKFKDDAQSFRLPQPKLRFKKDETKAWIFIPNFKIWIRFDLHRKILGEIKGATVIKDRSGKYFVSFVVKEKTRVAKPAVGEIGIDLGLKDFAVLSNGEKISHPKFLKKSEKRLKRLQRSVYRKVKGSKNRRKARVRLAKIHEKIRMQRSDYLHKLSRKIVDENQVIAMETLKVKNMVKNPKLSKAISDSGWGMFVSMIKYKSSWSGRSLRLIDQWSPSTKMCGECGFINEKLALSDREWTCESCSVHHDRDINAAKNILKIGRDTPEFKPVEKLASGMLQKKQAKVGSKKQELKVSTAVRRTA